MRYFALGLAMFAAIAIDGHVYADEPVASMAPNADASKGDFSGEVDNGGGRKLYLECRGAGRPTVILESGYHESSVPWSIADAYPPAVLPGVAEFSGELVEEVLKRLARGGQLRVEQRELLVVVGRARRLLQKLRATTTPRGDLVGDLLVALPGDGLFGRERGGPCL